MDKFEIGDKVKYKDEIYFVERRYSKSDVYLIGNKTVFCDMVSAHELKLIKRKNGKID